VERTAREVVRAASLVHDRHHLLEYLTLAGGLALAIAIRIGAVWYDLLGNTAIPYNTAEP
jgi:hypothetical protein